MENRIKQCQLDLFADRTSTATMAANQFRLWFASFAYVLICALRRIGLAHTGFARATCETIRLRLLKIGAWCGSAYGASACRWQSTCPWRDEFAVAPCDAATSGRLNRHEPDTAQTTCSPPTSLEGGAGRAVDNESLIAPQPDHRRLYATKCRSINRPADLVRNAG